MEKVRHQLNRPELRATYEKLTLADKANVSDVERLTSLVSGLAVLLAGLKRRSFGGLFLIGTGVYLLYRGLTGFCPAYRSAGINTINRASQGLRRTRHQEARPVQARPENTIDPADSIDEQIWESFPASDPPGNY